MKHGNDFNNVFFAQWRKNLLLAAILVLMCTVAVTHSVIVQAQDEIVMESADTAAEPASGVADDEPVAQQIQSLKDEVIALNRDLFILEEELLFPASTQTAVFLSMDVGEFFNLDSVELKIDDRTVTHYLYTDRQVSALFRGGMQRLWVGNLRTGEHEITAIFIGKGPQNREYRRAATLSFAKDTEPKMLEARVRDSTEKYQPSFEIVEWQ